MVGWSRKRVFPKTKGDSITGQDRAQKHCDFRFSQIEKKSKVAVLQLPQMMILKNKLSESAARLGRGLVTIQMLDLTQPRDFFSSKFQIRTLWRNDHTRS